MDKLFTSLAINRSPVLPKNNSDQGLIKTSIKQVGLKVHDVKGELFVSCANLPADENNLFIQSLQEFLDPVENPRYLLVKRSRFLKWIRQTDYFAIPSAISPNKKGVEIFKGLWKLYIGDCDIIYTRSAEGRRVLLKARKYAFSAIKKKASKVAIVFFRRLRLRKSKSVLVPATWKLIPVNFYFPK